MNKWRLPAGWRHLQLTETEEMSGVVHKLRRSRPAASLLVRVIEKPLHQPFDIGILPATLVTAFHQDLQDFKLIHRRSSQLGAQPAIEIRYQHRRGAAKEIGEYLMAVIPAKAKTTYIVFRYQPGTYPKLRAAIAAVLANYPDKG